MHPIPAHYAAPAGVWVFQAEHQVARGRSLGPLGLRRRGRARRDRWPGGARAAVAAGRGSTAPIDSLARDACDDDRTPPGQSCPLARAGLDGAIASGSISSSGGRRRGRPARSIHRVIRGLGHVRVHKRDDMGRIRRPNVVLLSNLPNWRNWTALFMLSGAFLAACGGHSARSTSTSSHFQPAAVAPLSAAAARKVASICRRSETPEDQNIVMQFANRGYSIIGPEALAALRTASHDVSLEGRRVRSALRSAPSSGPTLTNAMDTEAQILKRAARLVQARDDEAALLEVLHRRISIAGQAGVPSCAGAEQMLCWQKRRPPEPRSRRVTLRRMAPLPAGASEFGLLAD